jgi:hypothetical protein
MEGILRTKYSYKDAMMTFVLLSTLGRLSIIKTDMSIGGRPRSNTLKVWHGSVCFVREIEDDL